MPSVGHVAVGLAAARLKGIPDGFTTWSWASLLVVLSALPDVDVVAFLLGIPYGAPFGPRGAIHSLAIALLVGIVVWGGGQEAEASGGTCGLHRLPCHGQPWAPRYAHGRRQGDRVALAVHQRAILCPLEADPGSADRREAFLAIWHQPDGVRGASVPSGVRRRRLATSAEPNMSEDLEPIACRMDALTAVERDRRSEVLKLLRGRLMATGEADDGITFMPRARATAIMRRASARPPHFMSLMLMPSKAPARRGMSAARWTLSSA